MSLSWWMKYCWSAAAYWSAHTGLGICKMSIKYHSGTFSFSKKEKVRGLVGGICHRATRKRSMHAPLEQENRAVTPTNTWSFMNGGQWINGQTWVMHETAPATQERACLNWRGRKGAYGKGGTRGALPPRGLWGEAPGKTHFRVSQTHFPISNRFLTYFVGSSY